MRAGIRRVFAMAMVGGGIVGAGMFAFAVHDGLHDAGWTSWMFWLMWMALFAWAAVAGAGLWSGTQRGFRWAKLVFACQLPIVSLPGYKYIWFTGASIAPTFDFTPQNTTFSLALRAGAEGQAFVGAGLTTTSIGVNLFALAGLVFLRHDERRRMLAGTAAPSVAPDPSRNGQTEPEPGRR